MKESLAQRLVRLRHKRRLTQKQVAKELAISTSTYRDWEYGKQIKGEPYIRLAEIFDVGVLELMTGEVNKADELLKAVEVLDKSVIAVKKIAQAIC